jgi:hypothetical protein
MLQKDTHSTFVRGLVFGLIGAFLGFVLYSAVGIITGLGIGYVSLAVGYIVGRAVLFGSAGMGGRRYQILAALLTYGAVTLSAIPIGISIMMKEKPAPAVTQQVSATPENATNTATSQAELTPLGFVLAILVFAGLGLVSPLLGMMENPISGLISLVILFVGLRIAWTMTAGNSVKIMGPYNA